MFISYLNVHTFFINECGLDIEKSDCELYQNTNVIQLLTEFDKMYVCLFLFKFNLSSILSWLKFNTLTLNLIALFINDSCIII